MSQYICPMCGSKYIKIASEGDDIICTVGSAYVLYAVREEVVLAETPERTMTVHCAACSWHGALGDLQPSTLDA